MSFARSNTSLFLAGILGVTVMDAYLRQDVPDAPDAKVAAEPAPASVPTAPAPVAPTPSASRPSDQELQALRDEVATAEVHLALLKGQWESLVGLEQPWTDQVRAEDRPDAVRAMVEQALQESGEGELVVLDCDEYPCIIGVDIPMDDGTHDVRINLGAMVEKEWFADRSGNSLGLAFHPDETHGTAFFAFFDHISDDPEGLDLRVRVRRERQESLRRQAWREEAEQ